MFAACLYNILLIWKFDLNFIDKENEDKYHELVNLEEKFQIMYIAHNWQR